MYWSMLWLVCTDPKSNIMWEQHRRRRKRRSLLIVRLYLCSSLAHLCSSLVLFHYTYDSPWHRKSSGKWTYHRSSQSSTLRVAERVIRVRDQLSSSFFLLLLLLLLRCRLVYRSLLGPIQTGRTAWYELIFQTLGSIYWSETKQVLDSSTSTL